MIKNVNKKALNGKHGYRNRRIGNESLQSFIDRNASLKTETDIEAIK